MVTLGNARSSAYKVESTFFVLAEGNPYRKKIAHLASIYLWSKIEILFQLIILVHELVNKYEIQLLKL